MRTQYITDDHGKKVAVILPLKDYRKILGDLEDLEDIRLYDQAKAEKAASVPADEAFKRIEARRKSG